MLGFGGANFTMYSLWIPEQYPTECRASAFAFATSVGRFVGAGVTFLVGWGVSQMGTIGTPVAYTSLAFLAGLFLLPLGNGNHRRGTARLNLRQLFDLSFIGRRDETALEWAGAEYTFGEIDARSNRMAQRCRPGAWSAATGSCVYLANRIEMIDLYLACVKLGVIFVPVNILYREREMSHILSDAEPKLFVTDKELPALACGGRAAAGRASTRSLWTATHPPRWSTLPGPPGVQRRDPHAQQFRGERR